MTRILVAGCPRSGTTWVASVLGLSKGAVPVQEPDNPSANRAATSVQLSRGIYPCIEKDAEAPDYRQIWDFAFAGGWPSRGIGLTAGKAIRRILPEGLLVSFESALAPRFTRVRPTANHVITKSVMCAFAIDWIMRNYTPRVVVVERNPLDVVSSWLELDTPIGNLESEEIAVHCSKLSVPPPPRDDRHEALVAWAVGLLMTSLRRSAASHSDWLVVNHGQLSANAAQEFPILFEQLGLEWTRKVEKHLQAGDSPGEGYEIRRVASQIREVWRRRLQDEQVAAIEEQLDRFPGLARDFSGP